MLGDESASDSQHSPPSIERFKWVSLCTSILVIGAMFWIVGDILWWLVAVEAAAWLLYLAMRPTLGDRVTVLLFLMFTAPFIVLLLLIIAVLGAVFMTVIFD